MRTSQAQAVGAVALVVLASIAAGTVVAVLTARRLADPLQQVAGRAARLAEGDFRKDATRHGIPELDRVSDVLDSATVEIVGRLQREQALVAVALHPDLERFGRRERRQQRRQPKTKTKHLQGQRLHFFSY